MKNTNKLHIFFWILGLILCSCDNQLELKPENFVESSLNSIEDVESLMKGAYPELGGQFGVAPDGRPEGGELYGGDFNLMSELLGSDGQLAWDGTFRTYEDILFKTLTSENVLMRNNWLRAYSTINICNTVLKGLEDLDELGGSLEGEAKFIRGIVYFELVRFFALPWESGGVNSQLGVPLVLTPTLTREDAQPVARSSVADVYAQIIQDLSDAENLLPEFNSNGRATGYAASAQLARVYLQQGDFEMARDKANLVIESGIYNLNSRFEDAFNKDVNTGEDIFAIEQTAQFNAGFNNSGLATFYSIDQRADIRVLQEYVDLFDDPEDDRLGFIFDDSGFFYTLKWTKQDANIQVIRLAEMYLIRAESNFRLGTTLGDTPLNDINRLRRRAQAAELGSVTLDDLLRERRLELAFEGQRIHDLKRLQVSSDGFDYDAKELVLPIPQREIDASQGLIIQNAGY